MAKAGASPRLDHRLKLVANKTRVARGIQLQFGYGPQSLRIAADAARASGLAFVIRAFLAEVHGY